MRIRIICEGRSDERGIKKLPFSPALSFTRSGLAIDVRKLANVANVFAKIGPHVRNAVSQGSADRVFGIVDLIGSGPHVSGSLTPTAVKQALREKIDSEHRDIFHPHVAVHEIEAWVFADEDAHGRRLRSSAPSFGQPETINRTRSPAARLGELYRTRLGRSYKKTVELPLLFEAADPRVLYEKCPHFKAFLDDLARAGGLTSPFSQLA